MSNFDAIGQDPVTGLSGFRLEIGRGPGGIRMQTKRGAFTTAEAASTECNGCAGDLGCAASETAAESRCAAVREHR